MQVASLAEGVQLHVQQQLSSAVAVGISNRSVHGADRSIVKHATIGGEPVMLVLVLEGVGTDGVLEWCAANMLALFVHHAQDDPSGESLQHAGRRAFEQAHREAPLAAGCVAPSSPPSACTATLCAVNRLRDEITTCNVGAIGAMITSRGRHVPLSADHRLPSSPDEQRRLQQLGVMLENARDAAGRPVGPTVAWPAGLGLHGGLMCARLIGSVGPGVDPSVVYPVPACSTRPVPDQGCDLLVCSDGVWNELLVTAVASLSCSCPTPTAAAKLIVDSACAQRTSYEQDGYGEPTDDATAVVLRIGPSASMRIRKRPGHLSAGGPVRQSKSSKAAALFKRTSSSLLKRAWGAASGGGFGSAEAPKGLAALGLDLTPAMTPGMLSTPGSITPGSGSLGAFSLREDGGYVSDASAVSTSPQHDDAASASVSQAESPTTAAAEAPANGPSLTELSLLPPPAEAALAAPPMDPILGSGLLGTAPAVAPSVAPAAAPAVAHSAFASTAFAPTAFVGAPGGYTEEEQAMMARLSGSFGQLRVKTLLGEGSSSHVWHAEWAGSAVCVKVMRKCDDQKAVERFLAEIAIWTDLRHPNICPLLSAAVHDASPSMILEYQGGGSLDQLLHATTDDHGDPSRDVLQPCLVKRIVAEVAAGLSYLHTNGIIHRDVKSANVLLDEANHAKLTDFGVSTRLGRPSENYTAETGTYRNMAPEVILHKPYGAKCDVYSYAILLWECLHRQVPFAGLAPLQAAFAVAMQFARPAIDLPSEFASYERLVVKCWDADPEARPDMLSVVQVTSDLLRACMDGAEDSMHGGHDAEVFELDL
jgi:serine/threonine protein phosphatase PrpC/tRNA A-37 threonylcarbamoyl transferase component Bud32